ncbi:Type IV prepilin peptidase TadV/CpaA [Rhodovulum sp. PH10]|uniref:A24 family peptidase n=1 Tax=Rhodovulum sp. PH10 TaxID=1187851 RepID=UPI00027C1E64|nr:prepilin peptidase [Rhodovulum sp. PH10]EJW10947.1 Type IV prepilin peptidase TadV/CpaA [Rhodovulum sp. PH10]
MLLDAARLLVFPALMAFAASSDLFTMTISNRVSILLVLGFGALAVATGMSMEEALQHLFAASVVLAFAFVFFARGWIGGGDAKLAAATALWFGWAHLLDYLLFASVLGGALTLLLLHFRTYALPGRLACTAWIARLHQRNGGIPYGIALAASALMIYPSTAWMAS